jgi:hypothetical protein
VSEFCIAGEDVSAYINAEHGIMAVLSLNRKRKNEALVW